MTGRKCTTPCSGLLGQSSDVTSNLARGATGGANLPKRIGEGLSCSGASEGLSDPGATASANYAGLSAEETEETSSPNRNDTDS